MKFLFITFLGIVILVWTGMHLLTYFRLVSTFSFSPNAKLLFKLLLSTLALSFFLGRFFAARFNSYLVMEISYIWLGLISTLFFFLLLAWPVGRLMPGLAQKSVWTALILTLLVSLVGLYIHARGYALRQISISLPKANYLSRDLKLVHLSDLHIDGRMTVEQIRRLVDDTLHQSPDLILVTGDILEEDVPLDTHLVAEFSRLKAPMGTFAVTGNHELYVGVDHVARFLDSCGITLLRNRKVDLDCGLTLVGFDDEAFFRQDKGLRKRQLDILDSLSAQRFNLLMFHRPSFFAEHARRGVDLQLSGHTHAGQTVPLNLIVFLMFKYPYGLHHLDNAAIYTTSGTGIWGPPMRFPIRSEIVALTLYSAKTGGPNKEDG